MTGNNVGATTWRIATEDLQIFQKVLRLCCQRHDGTETTGNWQAHLQKATSQDHFRLPTEICLPIPAKKDWFDSLTVKHAASISDPLVVLTERYLHDSTLYREGPKTTM